MPGDKKRVAVIGGGSWGTALVLLLSNNLEKLNWWIRSNNTVEYINVHKRNPNYLRYTELPIEKINISTSMQEVIDASDIIVLAIPAAFLKKSLEESGVNTMKNKFVVSAIKGIVPEENMVISEFVESFLEVKPADIGFIAGPCHSEEVAMQKLSYLTLSGNNESKILEIAKLFQTWHLKISASNDLKGSEYAAVMKNVIAIAAGIASGLNYGDNFIAVLIANAIKEMKQMLSIISDVPRDISESVYLGDVIVTSYSQFSRNRLFGTLIGKGYSLKATMAEMNMVAEGYYAVKSLKEISEKMQIEMPVIESVYNIVYRQISPYIEFRILSEKLR